MKKLASIAIPAVMVCILAAGIVIAASRGVKNGEKAECESWAAQAKEYPLFFSADWQKEQCQTYGIALNK